MVSKIIFRLSQNVNLKHIPCIIIVTDVVVTAITLYLELIEVVKTHTHILGLGIGCNFMIYNQLQPTKRLSIIISLSHFCSNWVLEV